MEELEVLGLIEARVKVGLYFRMPCKQSKGLGIPMVSLVHKTIQIQQLASKVTKANIQQVAEVNFRQQMDCVCKHWN